MRVALYARYSSDQQSATSITDQLRSAREFAARHAWTVVGEFTDAAMVTVHKWSATTTQGEG